MCEWKTSRGGLSANAFTIFWTFPFNEPARAVILLFVPEVFYDGSTKHILRRRSNGVGVHHNFWCWSHLLPTIATTRKLLRPLFRTKAQAQNIKLIPESNVFILRARDDDVAS